MGKNGKESKASRMASKRDAQAKDRAAKVIEEKKNPDIPALTIELQKLEKELIAKKEAERIWLDRVCDDTTCVRTPFRGGQTHIAGYDSCALNAKWDKIGWEMDRIKKRIHYLKNKVDPSLKVKRAEQEMENANNMIFWSTLGGDVKECMKAQVVIDKHRANLAKAHVITRYCAGTFLIKLTSGKPANIRCRHVDPNGQSERCDCDYDEKDGTFQLQGASLKLRNDGLMTIDNTILDQQTMLLIRVDTGKCHPNYCLPSGPREFDLPKWTRWKLGDSCCNFEGGGIISYPELTMDDLRLNSSDE